MKKLPDYWSMKTDLLKKRQDPTLFANKDVQQKTRDYLIQNTKLKETQFFKKFDEEDQEKATKCFTMQEVQAVVCVADIKKALSSHGVEINDQSITKGFDTQNDFSSL